MRSKRRTRTLEAIVATGIAALAMSAVATALAATATPASEDGIERADQARDALARKRAVKRYQAAFAAAIKWDVAPKHGLVASSRTFDLQRVVKAARELEREADRAKQRAKKAAETPSPESVGVSQSTLEAIAACESGGDPTAVNAAGYYGKYQFDTGTWASVGGSGNPAAAPEDEQDYRAALLYSRAGSSPWPVCGH